MQGSSLLISEGTERVEELSSRAAGIIAAAKGTIKIRHAMKLVGFSTDEICNMTLYQRVRHQSTRLSVVDTQVVNAITVIDRPLSEVDVGSGDTVISTLSSAERTGGNTIETSEQSGNSDNTATTTPGSVLRAAAAPRRLNDNGDRKRSAEDSISGSVSSKSKKSRRSLRSAPATSQRHHADQKRINGHEASDEQNRCQQPIATGSQEEEVDQSDCQRSQCSM